MRTRTGTRTGSVQQSEIAIAATTHTFTLGHAVLTLKNCTNKKTAAKTRKNFWICKSLKCIHKKVQLFFSILLYFGINNTFISCICWDSETSNARKCRCMQRIVANPQAYKFLSQVSRGA